MESRTGTVEITEDEFSVIQKLIEARKNKLKGDNKRLVTVHIGKATNIEKRTDNHNEIFDLEQLENKIAAAFL